MRAIKISANPAEAVEIIEVEKDWQSLAAAIGRPCQYIERFRCPLTPIYNLVGVLDEDGQFNGQRLNQRAWPLYPMGNYDLRGTVLVLCEGMTPEGPDFVDLPDPGIALSLVVDLLEGALR